MRAERIITTTLPMEIDVTGITLLSIDEYEKMRNVIPHMHDFWWLRSPGNDSGHAAEVSNDGTVNEDGSNVNYSLNCVRPALILDPKFSNLEIGDKFKLKNYVWIVISERYAICDTAIGCHCFREDWTADDANDYEKSDVKKYLERWLNGTEIL